MRKVFIVTSILLLALLSACGSAPAAASTATIAPVSVTEAATAVVVTQASSTPSALVTDYADAATVEQQLLVGMLQLEGSDNAITVDQANQMLILWQSLNTFGRGGGQPGAGGPQDAGQPASTDSQSTPVAPTEPAAASVDTESVLAQIQAIFTDAQIQAIAALQITKASVETYISINNLSMQAGDGNAQGGNQPPQGNPPSADGAQPQGTPPADGGNGQGGPQASGTLQAPTDGAKPDMSTQVLLQAVIKLLQEKTGTTPQVQ
jgi:hypothetical protein